jgi:hypothetical protein
MKKIAEDIDKPPNLSLSSTTEQKNVENDNDLRGSLSSSTIEAKQPKTTTNRNPDSSSFSTPKKKKTKRQR